MKFAATLLAITALVAAQAAAVPSVEAEAQPIEARGNGFNIKKYYKHHHKHHHKKPDHRHGQIGFCGAPGGPCLISRGNQDDPLGDEAGYCGLPGNPCNTVKRAAHAIADALAEARAENSESFCGFPGQPCESAKASIDTIAEQARDAYATVDKREAEAEAVADPEAKHHHRHGKIGFCGAPGTPCLVGRDADPEAEARRHGRIGFCGAPGTPCLVGRDAIAEARHGKIGFCGAPGTPCLVGRNAEPRHGRIGFCGAPGTPCLVGRDAEAVGKIINNAHPTWMKQECFKPGNECHTLLKVHKAFHKVKDEADAAGKVQDPMARLAHCGDKNAKCGFLTHAHQYAKKHKNENTVDAERSCVESGGYCDTAKRDLDELEQNLDAAVGALHE